MTSSSYALPWSSGTAGTPNLKERLFGLTNSEGNHGEDVKEYYFFEYELLDTGIFDKDRYFDWPLS
jgi:hypothetical protein